MGRCPNIRLRKCETVPQNDARASLRRTGTTSHDAREERCDVHIQGEGEVSVDHDRSHVSAWAGESSVQK